MSGVSPSSAGPGATVTVTGSGFYSSNGVVLARVDGRPTGTDCPARSYCRVQIPNLGGGPHRVSLTISTSAGTSNSASFLYR